MWKAGINIYRCNIIAYLSLNHSNNMFLTDHAITQIPQRNI